MRGPAIRITVSVAFDGDLTPTRLTSIGQKLAAAPVQMLARQVRKKHCHNFKLGLGDGVVIEYPAKDGMTVNL